uniref:NADH dehydrogenase [ubiquinone] 1 alpha subcomplex assembly factor 3 n=1 Tax=Eucampia antarctica TaxID=49252 RepID=A0A7S2SGE9_9STRA|mmetsp:Transcript_7903/g.7502  ORF Transcript_7903/g.7502 Transcript_7903/m.7502 type:complete len:234 (+) Transcript_7903:52-753(+)
MATLNTLRRFHSQSIIKRFVCIDERQISTNEQWNIISRPRSYSNETSLSVMQCGTSVPKDIARSEWNTSIASSRDFSSISRGHDLLADSLRSGSRRKIILDGFAPTGFDVVNMLHYPKPKESDDEKQEQLHMTHMNGSIIAFPNSCFLWNVSRPKDVTLESLSVVLLHSPEIEFLFIGSDTPLPPRELNRLKKKLALRNIVIEQLDVSNAMGTFNILNGEDRRVAVALILPEK